MVSGLLTENRLVIGRLKNQGPLNPQPGQVYSLPKRRHLSHRQMVTLPQLGHWNLTAFSPGVTFFPHEIQDGISLSYYQAYSRLFKG